MSYLDSDAKDKLEDMLSEGTPMEVQEEPVQEPSPEPEVKEELHVSDVESEPEVETAPATAETTAQEAQEPPGMSDTGDSEGGHRVPYDRFKQVIDARNQLRNERDALSRQLAEMAKQSVQTASPQAQVAQAETPRAQQQTTYRSDVPVPEFMSEEEVEYFNAIQSEFGSRYQDLASRLHNYEMAMAEQQLDAQISQAVEKYPDVPRRAILEAVAGGNTNVMDVAERYSSFVAQLKEAAVADYLKDQPGTEAAKGSPKAPPRPARAAGAQLSQSQSQPEERPKSLKDAHRALSKFLTKNNLF